MDYLLRVFTDKNGEYGDAASVVVDEGRHIPDAKRQAIAQKLNTGETIFINDLFTANISVIHPQGEIGFAGVGVLATAWLLTKLRDKPTNKMQSRDGEITAWQEDDLTWVRGALSIMPPWDFKQLEDAEAIEQIKLEDTKDWLHTMAWAWVDEAKGLIRARTFAADWDIPEAQGNGSGAMVLAAKLRRAIEIKHGGGAVIFAKPAPDDCADIGGRVTEKAPIWDFTDQEKRLIRSIVAKGHAEEAKNDAFTIIGFDDFYALFEPDEVSILKKWLAIDPESIGYKLPFLGTENKPKDIVPIRGQSYTSEGKAWSIPCQYLSRNVYKAFQKLNEAMLADINKQLLVLYGYRSPARQVFIFFDILEGIYDFDFNKTIQRVCFPDYSEHVCTQRQAIDFQTQDGQPSEAFDTTDEYAWLQHHAAEFGFYESYPEDNTLGMIYEPWHWHYEAVLGSPKPV